MDKVGDCPIKRLNTLNAKVMHVEMAQTKRDLGQKRHTAATKIAIIGDSQTIAVAPFYSACGLKDHTLLENGVAATAVVRAYANKNGSIGV